MYADTLPELHEMAARIGMRRSWFQSNGVSLPHYDLVASRRSAAISFGAVEHDRRQMVTFLRAWRDKERGGATSLPKEEPRESERQGPAVQ
jgi:hypothetical protein